MSHPVNRRRYAAEGRRAAAARTRESVIRAAAELFSAQGYAATSMSQVAERAGVAVDTVYATAGRKPQLLLAAHDLLLGDDATTSDGEPLPALQRRYVREVSEAEGAEAKIRTYAAALGRLLPRTAPLLEALREAGVSDAGCREVWQQVEARRAANMRLFVAELRSTGQLRTRLDNDTAADLVWSMNNPTYYLALAGRGHDDERYADLVAEVWCRTLLD